MRHPLVPAAASILVICCLALTVACEHGTPASDGSPQALLSPTPAAPGIPQAVPGLPERLVTMMDACDPDTFNAPPPAGIGPGTCVRSGGVTFAKFLEQLGKHGAIGSWFFAPPNTSAKVGQVFVAVNRGGEEHTFTEVEQFGGGIVPPLNALTGNPVVAPECTTLAPDDFVAPGGSYREEPLDSAGTARFQCCIHPWMRLEVKVSER